MPLLFLGHGSPMNAVDDSPFRRGWQAMAATLPRPRAVLCVSAHWETPGVRVTSADRPETIHDFHGFPRRLFDVVYPAPGDPHLAQNVARRLQPVQAELDPRRGLDHGAWAVLVAMFPQADVPIVQLSLDTRRPASDHYDLARELAPLREQGVLVVASGNVVHNLRAADWGHAGGFPWAVQFDAELRRRIAQRDHAALIDYNRLGDGARLAIPTPEHYLPLLYALAMQQDDEQVQEFNAQTVLGSISMTSLRIG